MDGRFVTRDPNSLTTLTGKLSLIARLIQKGLGTRIYYVQIDGFEHHRTAKDRRRDIAHDARLTLLGYTVLRFDYVQIAQVLVNLVENAIKHTPTGTPIVVTARQVPGAIAVAVRDDSPSSSSSPAARAPLSTSTVLDVKPGECFDSAPVPTDGPTRPARLPSSRTSSPSAVTGPMGTAGESSPAHLRGSSRGGLRRYATCSIRPGGSSGPCWRGPRRPGRE